jgi:hypothetical protein
VAAFQIQPGPRYEGPHGPFEIAADEGPEATRVSGPRGEARLAWGMGSSDRSALQRGVAAHIGEREATLRRNGRALVLERDGEVVAVARRGRMGRVEMERPDGTPLARYKPTQLAGEVTAAAEPEDVELMLLLMASNAPAVLERRLPVPFLP